MPVIVVEDALSANAPHLRNCARPARHYIIGVKPGDHAFLFEHLRALDEAGQIQVLTLVDPATGVLHHFRFCSAAPLNESNPDELVNVLEYWEVDPDGTVQHFSWITDLDLSAETVWDIMRGGRARWKIENETFNTLKNQGYHLEHNYGTRRAEPVGGAGLVDDVGLLGGSSSATVLSRVPGGLAQDEDQVPALGKSSAVIFALCCLIR